jgi:hypothetical protein
MTAPPGDRGDVQPIGPPPPFDPELVPVVELFSSLRAPDAYRPDNIVEMRAPVPGVEPPSDEVLARGGASIVRQRMVPWPDGEPDISLLVCLPRHAVIPTAAIYHTHGGGRSSATTASAWSR